jgi:hypothetical protein
MNSNALAKLYDRLTPRERLPLIVAASGRGDEVERGRLVQTAPTVAYRLPDYHGLADALSDAALMHMLEVLHLVALFLHASASEERSVPPADREQDERWTRIVRLAAYLITARVDAWRRLCGELGIDPEVLLKDLPGYATVEGSEQAARALAFTAEEVAAFLRGGGGKEVRPVTAETYLAELREFLEGRERWWG